MSKEQKDDPQLKWEIKTWDVIDNYFKNINNYLSRSQLDSYNLFLTEQLPKTIRQFNPIVLPYGSTSNDFSFEIEIIIGGTCDDKLPDNIISKNEDDYEEDIIINNDGKGIYIAKPIIQQKKKKFGGFNYHIKQLYPNEARLKNLTYKSEISCDVFVKLKVIKQSNNTTYYKYKRFDKVPLGNIPIMLQSNACILNNMKGNMLYKMGECSYDQGGYFIIDGKEKVIVAQERQVENKIYVKKFSSEDYALYESEIRSVPENIFQPARITKISMLNKKDSPQLKIKENTLRVTIPNVSGDIPLFVLYRALGVISDKEIILYIIGSYEGKLNTKITEILRPSILEAAFINTQNLAFNFIKDRVTAYGKRIDNQESKFMFTMDIIKNYFLPHVGKQILPKIEFLSHMVREIIYTKLSIRQPTDRDSFINKRVDISGFLVGTIFRDLYFRVKNKLEENLNKSYTSKDTTSNRTGQYWKESPTNSLEYNFWNIIGDQDISFNKMTSLIDISIMNEGFMYAFKNCWGLKNAPCKQGIVQDLSRLNYLSFISHLRRVNTPIDKSAKIRAPHSLHGSSFGVMCPCETPDGGNIGVRKNISLFAQVTFGTNSEKLYKMLYTYGVKSIYNVNHPIRKECCKIFLNERLIGYHDNPEIFSYKIKLLRRNALINIYTSISWYVSDNIIKISTDSGRCCRPLYIVKNNRLKITSEIIDSLNDENYTWKNLICGTSGITAQNGEPFNDYDDNFYCTDLPIEDLEKTAGYIEYIDTEESNTSLIAMSPFDLDKSIHKFTHCEIHPSMMFGVLAANLPFVERNPAPRNQYSCAQAKQGLGMYASNFRNRMDTKGQIMHYPQKPIIHSKISKYLFTNDLPHGINAIVAIGCYSGYNQEDSILFNEGAVKRGLFRSTIFKTYSDREELVEGSKEREYFRIPDPKVTKNIKSANYFKLNDNGMIKEGIKVNENDIIFGKVIGTKEKDENGNKLFLDNSTFLKRNEYGIVDKVYFNMGNDNQKYAKVRIRKDKIPEVGDKFASRFGQKGTIGMIIPEEDMPFTKEGIVPDLIINPHAIPSRMTLGQLLEVILGKLCINIGNCAELTAFSNFNVKLMGDSLEKIGYEKNCNEVLYNGRTGKQLKVNVFIGPTFYQRLTHQVAGKFYSRGEGVKASLSNQPVGGRAAGGGLRIGEMERDAILAHGASSFLKESMMERSDKYQFYISSKSGLIAIVNKAKNIFEDFSNDSTEITVDEKGIITKKSTEISDSDFCCIEAPYTFKLFLQEIETMCIAPRLVVKKIKEKWQDISNITSEEMDSFKRDFIPHGYYTKKGTHLTKPLRSFHNYIKDILISGSSKHPMHNSLMDTSVGRGGDILKWYGGNYTTILGIDIERSGIEDVDTLLGKGARQRIDELKKGLGPANRNRAIQKWAKDSKIELIVADTSKNLRNLDGVDQSYRGDITEFFEVYSENSFDTISSQFSLHYYLEDQNSLENLFQNVRQNIKPNGYFLVTCFDGDAVFDLLKKNKDNLPIKGKVFDKDSNEKTKVWQINKGDDLDLSRSSLDDTLEEGFSNKIKVQFESIGGWIDEYLVSKKLVINVAAKYGLHIVNKEESKKFKYINSGTGMFKDIYDEFNDHSEKRVDLQQKNKHIWDLGSRKYRDLRTYSFLNRYYIFKYQDDLYMDNLNSKSKCLEYYKMKQQQQLNSKYKDQDRFILTAYDKKQLRQFIVEERANQGSGNITLQSDNNGPFENGTNLTILNLYLNQMMSHEFYTEINHISFSNTLNYMYETIGCGIFTKIKNNILVSYVPFADIRNPNLENGFNEKHLKHILIWRSMLENLCQNVSLSDVEFFINLLDSPTLDNPEEGELVDSYMPILSFLNDSKHSDLLLPNSYDWSVVSKKHIPPLCDKNDQLSFTAYSKSEWRWENRMKKAVFIKNTKADSNEELQKEEYNTLIHVVEDDWSIMNYEDENGVRNYKYALYGDICSSDNLINLLSSGSVLIKIKSPSKKMYWYSKFLIENEHYISVENDLSNLQEQINWCKVNDSDCEKMAENTINLCKKLFSEEGIYWYMEHTCNNISSKIQNNSVIENVFVEVVRENIIRDNTLFKSEKIGILLGKGGSNLKKLKNQYDCSIEISDTSEDRDGIDYKRIFVTGKESNITDLIAEIDKLNLTEYRIVPIFNVHAGIFIGKGGENIKKLTDWCRVTIFNSPLKEKNNTKSISYWKIIGIGEDIDLLLKIMDKFINMSKRNIINIYSWKDRDLSKMYNGNEYSTESEIILSKTYTGLQRKFGIIIPIYDLDEATVNEFESLPQKDDDGSLGYGKVEDKRGYTLEEARRENKVWAGKHTHFFKERNGFPLEIQEKILMDDVSAFSITASHFADQISELILKQEGIGPEMSIIDATACVGGNAMSFGKYFRNVEAIELDVNRASFLKHNMELINTHFQKDKRHFGSFKTHAGSYENELERIDSSNKDIIFFDPPWGGEDYDEHAQIMLTLGDKTMTQIVNTVSREFNFIVLKVPKNFDLDSFKKNLKEELTIVEEEDLRGGQRKVIKMKILIIKANKLANTKNDDDDDDDYINYERNGGGETTDILNENISKLKILLDTYRKSSQIDLPNYEIYVVRQQKKQVNYNIVPEEIVCNKNEENKNGFLKFNKGSLINTGCELAQKQNCDYIIIHNVHLLPKEDLIPEYFVYPENGPLNLSSSNDKYKLSGSFSHGRFYRKHERIGILSINTGHYQQINGFPNHMWGWGFEDKIFLDRLTKNNLYPKDIRYLENNITDNGKDWEGGIENKSKTILNNINISNQIGEKEWKIQDWTNTKSGIIQNEYVTIKSEKKISTGVILYNVIPNEKTYPYIRRKLQIEWNNFFDGHMSLTEKQKIYYCIYKSLQVHFNIRTENDLNVEQITLENLGNNKENILNRLPVIFNQIKIYLVNSSKDIPDSVEKLSKLFINLSSTGTPTIKISEHETTYPKYTNESFRNYSQLTDDLTNELQQDPWQVPGSAYQLDHGSKFEVGSTEYEEGWDFGDSYNRKPKVYSNFNQLNDDEPTNPDYIPTSPDYSPTSPGNVSEKESIQTSDLLETASSDSSRGNILPSIRAESENESTQTSDLLEVTSSEPSPQLAVASNDNITEQFITEDSQIFPKSSKKKNLDIPNPPKDIKIITFNQPLSKFKESNKSSLTNTEDFRISSVSNQSSSSISSSISSDPSISQEASIYQETGISREPSISLVPIKKKIIKKKIIKKKKKQ